MARSLPRRALFGAWLTPAARPAFDLAISGGGIGASGSAALRADIGVLDGRIAVIGDLRTPWPSNASPRQVVRSGEVIRA